MPGGKLGYGLRVGGERVTGFRVGPSISSGGRSRRLGSRDAYGSGSSRYADIDDDDDGEPRLTTTGYGYGMFTGIFAGHPACYHPGDNPGYQSMACWLPDRAASIVILVNDGAASIPGLLRQLLPAALES